MNRTVGTSVFLLIAMAMLTGCVSHRIAFQDLDYGIGADKNPGSVVTIIDEKTMDSTFSFKMLRGGLANTWVAQPGKMLKQVADVELPQMFERYEFTTAYEGKNREPHTLVLTLSVLSYKFENYHTTVFVHALAEGTLGDVLLDKTYTGQGEAEPGVIAWTGAFGVKTAVRRSSLDAYQQIFMNLRNDLGPALAKWNL